MDKRTFMKRCFLWSAVAVAAALLIFGLCFGKVIEESLFLEVAKYVVMWPPLTVIIWVFVYTLGQMYYDFHIRNREDKPKEKEDEVPEE